MAGILTPVSTAETPTSGTAQAPSPSPNPATTRPVQASPVGQGQTTLTPNNALSNLSPQGISPAAAPPIHNNQAINDALMQAFRPVVPDALNSLLGPAIGHIQSQTLPIAFYQPRPVAPASIRRSS